MLSEEVIQDAFHKFLKLSLSQAKIEHLLDAEVLSSAEADLMITGPALCLFFAALRCSTNPPSVLLPRSVIPSTAEPVHLSHENCPPAFAPFLRVWAQTVPRIQSLGPEQHHDLARIICGLPPLTNSADPRLRGISAELQAVALEISQRRSFQNRYASDLQAALDSGSETPGSRTVSFVPPPLYEEKSSVANPTFSPVSTTPLSPTSPRQTRLSPIPPLPARNPHIPPPSPSRHSPIPPSPSRLSSSPSRLSPIPPSPSRSSHQRPSRTPSRTPSPTLFTPTSPAIEFIRETLYAALGDTLEENPSLHKLLETDPSRAYFASVSLAILAVSTRSIDSSTNSIIGVLGARLSINQCPPPLRPFMTELIAIGNQVRDFAESDDKLALECIQRGEEMPSETMMDRVMKVLFQGVGYDDGRSRGSLEGRAVAFANRIGGLALKMTGLSAFRERQDMVFKVLAGIKY